MATVTGVKRALAHQAVHANFGTQPAESVFTTNMHGGTLDTGNLSLGQLDNLRIKAVLVRPAQIHAQQDIGPVLRFGTTGAGLNIQVAVVGVHIATEHAAEFELLQRFLQSLQLSYHIINRALVILFGCHFEQLAGVSKATTHLIKGADNLGQLGALAPQVLGTLGFIPDARVFQLALYFGQTITFVIVVKDTP